MDLPEAVVNAVQPLLDALPLDLAMEALIVKTPRSREYVDLVSDIVQQPSIARHPALCAGLWLYVDDLDRSHAISQGIHDTTGSFWHGIMHRREGDFGNSHYWFNRVGEHPAMAGIPNYDPHAFVDDVEARHRSRPPELIALQQKEWETLFTWCATA